MTPLPFLTATPGAGGQLKSSPEDFEVEELPAYEPNGEAKAEHLFVWVEKRGHSTQDVAKALARHVGVPEREVSWAGLKDKHALTRQYLCLPAVKAEPKLSTFALEGVTVLRSARHRNKLKTGHLAGNRFTLRLREVVDLAAAHASLAELKLKGVPNAFGAQRFGLENAQKGKAILLAGGRHRDRFERKLFLSAYQSLLFNEVLARRLNAGTFFSALSGDVLKKHESHGEFLCEAPEVDTGRVQAFEISATGPMFGPEMRQPTGPVRDAEWAVLTDEGVALETFTAGGDETRGTRRFLRVPLADAEWAAEGSTLTVRFSLPAGSYATVVMGEVMKSTHQQSS